MLKNMGLMSLLAFLTTTSAFADNIASYDDHQKKHKSLSFALIGDVPYGDQNVGAFDALIDDVNDDKSIKFVMHAGDIKSGGAECTNERLEARFYQYQKFNRPFVFTPGDNEWTDCHRENNGQYNPIERLEFLRTLFYPNPRYTTGGQKMRVKTQANQKGFEKFVENTLFRKSGVVFSSIHVVGSNNNLRPWSGIDAEDSFEFPRTDRLQEFNERNDASIAWLTRTFEVAKKKRAEGVVVMIHANPQLSTNFNEESRAGFNDFLDVLLRLTADFAKPVLLAHGDSHVYFTDKPKLVPWYADGGALSADDEQTFAPNLSRVQTFGDTPQHWVRITINHRKKDLFVIEPQVVSDNL